MGMCVSQRSLGKGFWDTLHIKLETEGARWIELSIWILDGIFLKEI